MLLEQTIQAAAADVDRFGYRVVIELLPPMVVDIFLRFGYLRKSLIYALRDKHRNDIGKTLALPDVGIE